MHAGDSHFFSNISATTDPFALSGGRYVVATVASWGDSGSVKLQRRMPDGSTYVSVGSSTDFSATGSVVLELGPGIYALVIDTATAVYAEVVRLPIG